MKPAPFAYAKARSLDHAIELLGRPDGDARVLAGGQSLIATLNMRLSAPKLLVDINGVGALSGIAVKDGMVEIGALTRHVEAERSAEIAQHAPLLALALPHIGHAAIRNRGTLGGSLAFADPAAELRLNDDCALRRIDPAELSPAGTLLFETTPRALLFESTAKPPTLGATLQSATPRYRADVLIQVDAARDQLTLLGMPAANLKALEESRTINSVSRVLASMDGTAKSKRR